MKDTKKDELCTTRESSPNTGVTAKPKYTVRQEDESWHLKIEVPGSKKGDVDVSFEDGILDIKAHRTEDIPETWRPLNFVGRPSEYRLRLDLPETIATEKIEAHLEDGVLQLDLPVSDAVKPRAIAVK